MSVRVESKVHFTHVGKRQRKLSSEPLVEPIKSGRIPRITRMLALAHRFDRLIRREPWWTKPTWRVWAT